jgi:hypothetical protein
LGSFSYQPEFNYDAVNPSDSPEVVKHLLPFKGGFLKGLEAHLVNADNVQKFLASAPPELRKDINKNIKDIDGALVSIMRLYGHIEDELSNRSLETAAHREYYNHFSDADMDEAKVEFVKLVRTYEVIKEFNDEVLSQWWRVAHIFEAFNPTNAEKHYLEQILTYRVYPRIDLCSLTNLLLRRLAYLLKITSEKVAGGKISAEGEYTSQVQYTYSAVFREDLASVIESDIARKPRGEGRGAHAEPVKESRDSAVKSAYLLDTRGSEHFNQTHAHVLEIDPSRYSLEEAKVKRSIYVETHLGAEDEALRQDLIRKFISAARNKDRVGEYHTFLLNYFQFTRDTILMQQTGIPDTDQDFFLYHFGPVFFVKVCTHFMRIGRTGYVHRPLKRNQMVRELPFEYVKYVLKEWWDEHVYAQVPRVERNNFLAYERLLGQIRAEWQEHQIKLLSIIRRDPDLLRALNLHDVRTLGQFVEMEISYLYHVKILRFLGQDFFYLPIQLNKATDRK